MHLGNHDTLITLGWMKRRERGGKEEGRERGGNEEGYNLPVSGVRAT